MDAARAYRVRDAGLEDEYVVDPIVVRLLVELDREQEAIVENEQSEHYQRLFQCDPLTGNLYAYLLGRTGRVWAPSWRSLLARKAGLFEYVGGKPNLLGDACRWAQPGFVPTPEDAVAYFWLQIAGSLTTFTPATRLRIVRRAHAALPDEPHVKRALAEEEWRTAKDYGKALRLIREVIAVVDPRHMHYYDLRQEEGRYGAAVRYRREHGEG